MTGQSDVTRVSDDRFTDEAERIDLIFGFIEEVLSEIEPSNLYSIDW